MLDSAQGPVTAGGTLRNGYFFSLDPDCALELLRRAGLETASETADEGGEHTEPIEGYVGGASDRPAIVAVRSEQGFPRDQQLRRWGSSCSFCGLSLPEELCVAVHIKPRWACSENERMDTRNMSMLAWPVRLRTRPGPGGPLVVGRATQGPRPGPRTGRGLEGPATLQSWLQPNGSAQKSGAARASIPRTSRPTPRIGSRASKPSAQNRPVAAVAEHQKGMALIVAAQAEGLCPLR